MYRQFYRLFFDNISLWEKLFLGPSASHYAVVSQFGHYQNWFQSLMLGLGAWASSPSWKITVCNCPLCRGLVCNRRWGDSVRESSFRQNDPPDLLRLFAHVETVLLYDLSKPFSDMMRHSMKISIQHTYPPHPLKLT